MALGSDIFVGEITGNIAEYTTSGSLVNASVVSGLKYPFDIAVSGSDIFVTNTNQATVSEYTTSGQSVSASLISGLAAPYEIAASGSDLYVGGYEGSWIAEYTTSGTFLGSLNDTTFNDFAIGGPDVFFTNNAVPPPPATYIAGDGNVGELSFSGGGINPFLVAGMADPTAIAVVVPEPATEFILLIAALSILLRRRRAGLVESL